MDYSNPHPFWTDFGAFIINLTTFEQTNLGNNLYYAAEEAKYGQKISDEIRKVSKDYLELLTLKIY